MCQDLLTEELPEPAESSEVSDLADRPLLRQIKGRFGILSVLSDTVQTKIDTKKWSRF